MKANIGRIFLREEASGEGGGGPSIDVDPGARIKHVKGQMEEQAKQKIENKQE